MVHPMTALVGLATLTLLTVLGQNNRFSDNSYFGPWRFMAHDTSNTMDYAEWQAAPYAQDEGSSLE